MVAIQAVKDGLFGVSGYRACLMEWALCVMGLTCDMKVKRLEVDCASGLTNPFLRR